MKGAKTNRLGMFSDVREVLDAALAAGGGSYECGSHGQAVHWRQRAYRFRKLYAELHSGESRYDTLTMPRCVDNVVQINVRRAVGKFTPTDEPITAVVPNDDLFDFAAEFAKRLEGDTE